MAGEQTDELVRAAFPLRLGLAEGKVALVTGAGRGIGEATARLFAVEGAAVVVCDIDGDAAQAVVRSIQERGGEAFAVAADLTKEDDVAAVINSAIDNYGRLDCAVNNAGVSGRFGSFIDLPLHEWQHMINANLTSVFLCLKYELGVMAAQGSGAIVNVSSGAGVVAAPGLPHYTAAKHGVLGLTKCAAQEFAAKGVRVNAILPGTTRTPMIEGFMNQPYGYVAIVPVSCVANRCSSTGQPSAAKTLVRPRTTELRPRCVDPNDKELLPSLRCVKNVVLLEPARHR
jgi:NAD(P)-dependent dehydrogenase (short-subunit alcohol dehydrogenase family)